jgi:hypothetical protein
MLPSAEGLCWVPNTSELGRGKPGEPEDAECLESWVKLTELILVVPRNCSEIGR